MRGLRSACVALLCLGASAACVGGPADPELSDPPDSIDADDESTPGQIDGLGALGPLRGGKSITGLVPLDVVLAGLNTPLGRFVGNQAARLLVSLIFSGPDYTPQFHEIAVELEKLENLSLEANTRLTMLESQLRVTKSELEEAGFTSRLSAPVNHIETLYSGNASGGTDPCDPSRAVSSSLCWFLAPNRDAATKRRAAPDFVRAVEPGQLLAELAQIHVAISPTQGKGLLENYSELVGQRASSAGGDIAKPLDALENRFITLVRTQIHGLRVLAAYYRFKAELDPTNKDIHLANLDAALSSYKRNFAREADAYVAAAARYAAVVGGDPTFLTKDPVTGAHRVDAQMLDRLSRVPAVANAVRAIGAGIRSESDETPSQDVVHALFLARQTDDAFANLTITAKAMGSPTRQTTATLDGRELHTGNGRYGAFVTESKGGPTVLALSDGWFVYDVKLALPGASTGGKVELVAATSVPVGRSTFSKTWVLQPAFAPAAGEGAVYVAADDFRMDGPTARVDLFPWSGFENKHNCRQRDNYGSNQPIYPEFAGTLSNVDGMLADVKVVVPYGGAADCNVTQATSVRAVLGADATNAIVFSTTRQTRTADLMSFVRTGFMALTHTMEAKCADNLFYFGTWKNAFQGTNAIALGTYGIVDRSATKFFMPDMTTTCDPDFSSDVGSYYFTSDETVRMAGLVALASREGAKWDSGLSFVASRPQIFTRGADATLNLTAGLQVPTWSSKVHVQTRLMAFGVYVP